MSNYIIDHWHKQWSVWLTTLAIALSTAYDYLPGIKDAMPDHWYKWAFLIILVARLWKQQR